MNKENIIVIRNAKRRENADELQKVLTEYGCIIKTRLGLHEAGDACSNTGLIILQLTDESEEIAKLEKALSALEGITYQSVRI